MEGDTDRTGLMCTAYRNADGSWVMVAVNYATEAKNMTFHVDDRKVKSWQPYLTAEGTGKNLQPIDKVGNGKQTVIPARSIVTFVKPVRRTFCQFFKNRHQSKSDLID